MAEQMAADRQQDGTEAAGTPILTIDGTRATVRLNRPALHNRIEPPDLERLAEIFAQVERDPSIRVLVLTGTGKTFSSGFHLGALSERTRNAREGAPQDSHAESSGASNGAKRDNNFGDVVDRLENLACPTICALNGGVYGGSTDLALACDFRIGVEDMRMFMPAARLGLHYYESGLRRYVSRLGLAGAKRLFLTAEQQDGPSLLRMGFIDELVPPGELMARVDALAATLAANAPLAVRGMKQALNRIAADQVDSEALEAARALCAGSEDIREGLAAWAEKRKPVFQGR